LNQPPTIAIVGIGGVFPGAEDLESFLENIMLARASAREPPAGRWLLDLADVYDPSGPQPDRIYSRRACFVDDFPLDTAGLEVDKPLRLEVRKSNAAAMGLYLGSGFRRVGEVEGYYGDGEDAVLMEK